MAEGRTFGIHPGRRFPLELGVDLGATGLDKYGTSGPRFGLLAGRKDLVGRIRVMRLVALSHDGLRGYAVALEAGWSPDTTRDVSAEQLALLRRDPAALIEDLTRQGGTITTALGVFPRLPNRVFWLDDGEFCGNINLRFARGTDELPPHVHGHIGYAVVPWKRRRGYATEAFGLMLPVAREVGLKRLPIPCDDDNEASRRVIVTNGGVLEHSYSAENGKTKLKFWIDLASG